MKARTTAVGVPMRDGVKLAVDVILPPDGESFPVVLSQGRYWRSYLVPGQPPGPLSVVPPSTHAPKTEELLQAGFAVVNADTRGTGASEGAWPIMWSDDEVADAHDLVAWIAQQPWCDGSVLAAGLSYEGTTAVLAGGCGHPAVRGSVARGFEWDVFDDIVAPGGVLLEGFLREWSASCHDLDRNVVPSLFGRVARIFVRGGRPLDDDPGGERLAKIVAERHNPSVLGAVRGLRSAADPYGTSGTSLRQVALSSRAHLRGASVPPMQIWGSWMDGATARTVLRMFATVPAVREARIGAWSHTGEHGASLGQRSRPDPPLEQQSAQQIAFLQGCVQGTLPARRTLHYFTMGEDAWHTTQVWPPEGITQRTMGLDADGGISSVPPPEGSRSWRPDASATTGTRNRWHTANAKPIALARRHRAARRLLSWRTPPLPGALVITGEPELLLTLTTSYDTPAVFAYLELVDPDGHVHYVTEAIGRSTASAHARGSLTVRFLPTSVRVPSGWQLQLGLAATDADTFPQELPTDAAWTVHTGAHAAELELPVRR